MFHFEAMYVLRAAYDACTMPASSDYVHVQFEHPVAATLQPIHHSPALGLIAHPLAPACAYARAQQLTPAGYMFVDVFSEEE